MAAKSDLTAIDLFCGCGGISVGLRTAGLRIVSGVDMESRYLDSFSHNFPSSLSINADLSALDPVVFMRKSGIEPEQLDLLAGGPPCQGFSKNVPRKYRYLSDPNNLLIKTFLDYCESVKPNMVLMENVAEMKNGFKQSYTDEIVERLEDEGYTVTYAVVNSADYGVPQRRRRAFFIANRLGIKFNIPTPTHVPASTQLNFLIPTYVTVWQAISDLPRLRHGEGIKQTEYLCEPQSEYQELMRDGQTTVSNHVARPLRPLQYARLAALEPGEGNKELPDGLKVKSGYSGAYGRLTWDMIAPTITRWVFHPGSGRWGHPEDIRTLTIREAARIQGFPDSYEFLGSYTQQAGQVGNAVPPLLASKIVSSMLSQLGMSARASKSINSSYDSFS
jgi:DNA (cytosine-5)-methyltransferase 1